MEAMAERVKAQPQKMKLRKQLCEHPFGTIKRWFGYTHFLLKGLEKVRPEGISKSATRKSFLAAPFASINPNSFHTASRGVRRMISILTVCPL
jgi:hypothetical protein